MSREIIMVGGGPASGKSRLCKSAISELRFEMSIEHLAVGDIIRSIGRGAIKSYYAQEIKRHLNSPQAREPINNTVLYRVMTEALASHDAIDTLLVDGYPRYLEQVDDMYDLARENFRHLAGLIVTHTPDENDAIMRMLKRRPRDYEGVYTVTEAKEQIERHNATYGDVKMELHFRDLPMTTIDTTGLKADTTEEAIIVIQDMLRPGSQRRRNAS